MFQNIRHNGLAAGTIGATAGDELRNFGVESGCCSRCRTYCDGLGSYQPCWVHHNRRPSLRTSATFDVISVAIIC